MCAGSSACLDQAERRDAFSRSLRTPVTPETVAALMDTMNMLEANKQEAADAAHPLGPGSSQTCEDGWPPERTRKD